MSLKIDDLDDILTELHPAVTNEWEKLGRKLGLSYDELQALPDKRSKQAALTQMLAEVLHRFEITWQKIADALRDMKETPLADKIIEKKCPEASKRASRKRKPLAESPKPVKKQKRGTQQKEDAEIEESSSEDPSSSEEDEEDSLTVPEITPLSEFYYPMDKKIHGRALIINIFKQPEEELHRHGSNKDRDELEETLKILGYEVCIENDLNAAEMKEKVLEYANETKSCDSFVCCILAHGSKGKVVGADGKKVEIEDISKQLVQIKHLGGKPKIFFIQACQGPTRPAGIEVADSQSVSASEGEFVADSTVQTLPRDSDFFFGIATSPGTISARHPEKGSRYIQTLCYILKKQFETEDLVTMVTRVHNEVAKVRSTLKNEKKGRYQQQPQLVSTLRKLVQFN